MKSINGTHSTTAVECPFWAQRFNYDGIQALVRKRRDELIASRPPHAVAPKPGKPAKKSALTIKGPLSSRPPAAAMGFKKPTPPNGLRGPIPPPPLSLVQAKISFTKAASDPMASLTIPDPAELACLEADRRFEELMAEAKAEMVEDMEGFMEGGRPLLEGIAASMHADHKPSGGSDELSLSYI